jgi:hypothetical protein
VLPIILFLTMGFIFILLSLFFGVKKIKREKSKSQKITSFFIMLFELYTGGALSNVVYGFTLGVILLLAGIIFFFNWNML